MSRTSALALLALVGCHGKDDDTGAPITGPSVLLDPTAGFWGAPLPSDHRIAGGAVDLEGFPNPDATPIVSQVLSLLDGVETGWGTTSAVFLPTDAAIDPASLPDLAGSLRDDASVYLVDVDPLSPETGRRWPARVTARERLVFGPEHGIVVLPLQGNPLRPNTRYAAVVTTGVRALSGASLVPSAAVRTLIDRGVPDGFTDDAALTYTQALQLSFGEVAGLAVFRTGDPVAPMAALVDDIRLHPLVQLDPPALTDVFDEFCVFEGRLEVVSYQTGDAPFLEGGGGIAWSGGVPVVDHTEQGRFWVTLPRGVPLDGWPTAVMVRTGGGGDRPMVDRGTRDADGNALDPGEGPARYFARAGYAGFQYDGPLGGERNPTGGDEQFLVFNVTNPEALRDNLRQSAAELALIPGFLDQLAFDASACPDTDPAPWFRTDAMGLMGHSMGATIAPLVLPQEPAYTQVILSGAGGSWIENIVHKQSPLEVRPLAEAMLGYPAGTLTEDDPFLSLLQWAGESADPPVHGAGARTDARDLLVFQGIVDTYILPPIANATNLSFRLDLAGDALDAAEPRLDAYDPLGDLQIYVGTTQSALPAQGNQEVTAVVVQHPEDGVEDGHEVMFQQPTAKAQYQCFLSSSRTDRARVIAPGESCP